MGKSLDKMTKAELLEMVRNLQTSVIDTSTALAQRDADVARLKGSIIDANAEVIELREQLESLENRRKFENQAYRSKARRTTEPKLDMAKLAARYCEEHNVRSVSKDDLIAYARAQH